MMILNLLSILCRSIIVIAYSNNLFTLSRSVVYMQNEDICHTYINQSMFGIDGNDSKNEVLSLIPSGAENSSFDEDPYITLQRFISKVLFGPEAENQENKTELNIDEKTSNSKSFLHFPSGQSLRDAELFDNKTGVHLPISEMMHQGHCMLNVTEDYMQTAVDAFGIFINGNLDDISRLPADYVLRSARTISMLKISHEKLAMTWQVVKGQQDPSEVTYDTLEMYRPLFKYLNGREIARLNLMDPRILNYIGTHPDLDRHQVGVVASKYIKLNGQWSEPKFLNMMNNLLCGIPMSFMRKIPENTYLQLSHQVFYHTRACDPLQRRFYLVMMTKTQALGKSYGWNAQDVSRLGLLMAEVEGEDLSSIKPKALTGLSAQVMMAMHPENLVHLTKVQLQHLGDKAYNILVRKIKKYQDYLSAASVNIFTSFLHLNILLCYYFK